MTPEIDTLSKLISRIGFPSVVVLLLLFQLMPKIDRGIAIADEVDGKLNYMIVNCQQIPVVRPITP